MTSERWSWQHQHGVALLLLSPLIAKLRCQPLAAVSRYFQCVTGRLLLFYQLSVGGLQLHVLETDLRLVHSLSRIKTKTAKNVYFMFQLVSKFGVLFVYGQFFSETICTILKAWLEKRLFFHNVKA